MPDTELRPNSWIGWLARSPVRPSSPQLLMLLVPPHRRLAEKIASTCCMVRPLIGLSLCTKIARASTATGTAVGL
ncbi:hypothetical protein D3C84_668750 [compost metagenome]